MTKGKRLIVSNGGIKPMLGSLRRFLLAVFGVLLGMVGKAIFLLVFGVS